MRRPDQNTIGIAWSAHRRSCVAVTIAGMTIRTGSMARRRRARAAASSTVIHSEGSALSTSPSMISGHLRFSIDQVAARVVPACCTSSMTQFSLTNPCHRHGPPVTTMTGGPVSNVARAFAELPGGGDRISTERDHRKARSRIVQPQAKASPPSAHDRSPASPAPWHMTPPWPSGLTVLSLELASGKSDSEIVIAACDQCVDHRRLM